MTNRVRPRAASILNRVLELSITAEDNPNRKETPNWDSLKHMELILSLEEEFNIRFSIEQFTEIHDFNDIVKFLEVNDESQHNS